MFDVMLSAKTDGDNSVRRYFSYMPASGATICCNPTALADRFIIDLGGAITREGWITMGGPFADLIQFSSTDPTSGGTFVAIPVFNGAA
jgi:hypothetical protein